MIAVVGSRARMHIGPPDLQGDMEMANRARWMGSQHRHNIYNQMIFLYAYKI